MSYESKMMGSAGNAPVLSLIALSRQIQFCATRHHPDVRLPPLTVAHLSTAPLVVPLFAAQQALDNQETNDKDEVLPLIQFVDVPLSDAVRRLARQARLNYILDPGLSGSSIDPQGNRVQASMVSRRWEKVTARQALNALLKDHNPATSTNRITLKKEMDEKSILRKNAIEK